MTQKFIAALAVGLVMAGLVSAQQKTAPSPKPESAHKQESVSTRRRAADGHPDLSGGWTYAIDVAPVALKKVTGGKVTTTTIDQSARHEVFENVPGALPWTKAPSYRPEFQEKVKYLAANESKLDGVFYCGRPGVPRIGSPRRIIQLPGEFIFLYEEISGNTFRVIPTDGRKHRESANPSYYGDSVGHWEGDTLVVDTTNFVEDTWFGEEGYFHSDAMHVIERLWRIGENLAFQVTVDDPKVLTQPWTNFAHLIKPSSEPLEESPVCKEDDGNRLLNLDHHLQR
ncbi:MAG: hypothetical protein C5B57_03980 [Blastocatellia bacterium]|nr:MAG: hypothetical protein C5B57_03980 [Blastocatellia bacterium]